MGDVMVIERRDEISVYGGERRCMHQHEVYSRPVYPDYESDVDVRLCLETADFEIASETSTDGGRPYRTRRWYCDRHVPRRLRQKARSLEHRAARAPETEAR